MTQYREFPRRYDLITPDGVITKWERTGLGVYLATVFIEEIPDNFVGFLIEPEYIYFNIKSTLAQLGVNGVGVQYHLDFSNRCAEIEVELTGIGPISKELLKLLGPGVYIGKLFAADQRRRVRDPDYLSRMFGRADRWGRPLLSLGGMHGTDDLILDKIDGRAVAYLTLQNGRLEYSDTILGFLPTLAKALGVDIPFRDTLRLHQEWHQGAPRNVNQGEILLVRTLPLHIRTVFAKVVDANLSPGFSHTTANVLQPDTADSGDVYELFGESKRELTDIPLEFFTLEPYREYVFFADRDQLQSNLEKPKALFQAFETAPEPLSNKCSVFIVKGTQMQNLTSENWVSRDVRLHEFPGLAHGSRQALMVQRYIEQQPAYPFLRRISEGDITSQGVLLTRYFPSPLLKRMLLSHQSQLCLKGIYFEYPSHSYQEFFSSEDRALLHDLHKFAIPTFWVDRTCGKILQYVERPNHDTGMFVPLDKVQHYLKATFFGIYGSNLSEGNFETELKALLNGLLTMKNEPLALVTGGGPGIMEMGNRIAKELGILSCANIVDFRTRDKEIVNEQLQNPYIEAKMTYRLDQLVERQAEFHLDFPIFLTGGIGTDFEFSLEEVRMKVGATPSKPILLFGTPDYWRQKITSRYQCNLAAGTIKGSEWISNSFFCVQTAQEGLAIYKKFFEGGLTLGKEGPLFEEGFRLDTI